MSPRLGVRAVLILIGFTASIGQIVLLRELMVVFYGNEMSIGLMLASWLFWTAVGSGAAGGIAARARDPRRLVAAIEALVAFALPLTIVAVRWSKGALETAPGELLGPGAMLLTSAAALSLFCALSGALFTAATRLCATESAEASGTVYLWEAVGSAVGGMIAGLALVRYLGSLEIAGLLAVLNVAAACSLVRRWVVWALPCLAALAFFPKLEQLSIERLWRGFHLLATRNSVYGSLAVVGDEASRSVYENGLILFTTPDPASAEEAVHYALLEHPAPKSVLLIGGGLNGSIAQALQHPGIQRLDYVELDPAILDLGRQSIPKDARVRVHVMDGRLFVKVTNARFDVIIVNVPDPQNAQLNRFYTEEFFREAARRLTPTGLLSFRLTGSENYISPERADFLRSIRKTLGAVFPDIAVIPGESVHFFAAQRAGVLASGADELLARLRARNLQTTYVREYYIPFRMMPDRVAQLESQIRPLPETPVNRDFAPIAYYFDVALWSSRFHPGYARLFRAMAAVPFGAVAAAFAVLLMVLTTRRSSQVTAGCCTAGMGFTMMGLEILLLLGFQALYGYVYQQLAVLIAAFMGGMALGSWLAMRRPARAGMRVLAAIQILAAAAPLLLYALARVSPLVFPALALLFGTLGGYEFALASRVFFAGARPHGAGALYALDLAGSSAGAILFAAWFVPVYGFFRTGALTALVCLGTALMAARGTALRPGDARQKPPL